MSRDFTVTRVGTDSSGRGIYMTGYMAAWWAEYVDRLGFTPVITQGAHMTLAGGGAKGSAGYHDEAGTLDLRTRDRTAKQVRRMIRVARRMGAAAYLRNMQHGGFKDPHVHMVIAGDRPLSSGAAWQVAEYRAGRDGLASRGPDYHWRPSPLVLDWEPTSATTPGLSRFLDPKIKLPARRRLAARLATRGGTPEIRSLIKKWQRQDAKERKAAANRKKWADARAATFRQLRDLEVKR